MDQLKTAIREKGIAVEELCQYSYDTNRNQTDIKNTKTGEDQTYVYDAENRLSQVSMTKDGKTAVIQQNIYNGEGQRIQKIDGDETINYYYQDGVVAYTTDTNGNQNSTQYYLYNKDIQGSTSILVKEDGSADAIYQYTDFGETMIQGYDQAKNEICYAGGIYDQSTGLYYLNARYYNPEDGRFLTEDTYHGENDKPDTQHLYVYCANNPVNYVDPSGHYAVALYTLVKIVAGGVVFYVSYSTWKRRRIKTRYAGKRVTFKTKISVWLTWRTFNRIMYSKSKSKSNTKNKGESKKSKKDPQMHQSGQNIKNKRKEKVKTICNKNTK